MLLFGFSAATATLRGDYRAAGALMAGINDERPHAVMGDSPLLANQLAYNSKIIGNRITQLYSLQEFEQWLQESMNSSGKGWFLLENTNSLENTDLLDAVEAILFRESIIFSRHFFSGPQNLFVYDLSG